jgi:hypothetical protein
MVAIEAKDCYHPGLGIFRAAYCVPCVSVLLRTPNDER